MKRESAPPPQLADQREENINTRGNSKKTNEFLK
jgi:hypothetical protein